MADVKWIKLATGLPDNRKIKQIRRLPEGDSIALMWIFLMCLAGETNDDGMVYFTPEIPFTDEMLADQFSIDINTIRLGLTTFQRFGMIEVVDDIICLPSWEKWQAVDKLSAMREQTRKRVAKHREKQKLSAGNVTCNVTVTQGNATDIDIEEDKEEEKDICMGADAQTPKKSTKFIPPTVEEVTAYCKERNNRVDACRFVDFYTAKGWMLGKNKMKDWKSAVRTWERNSSGYQKPATPQINRNDYDNGDQVPW